MADITGSTLTDEKEAERRVPGLNRCQTAILNACESLRQAGHSPSAVISALIGSLVTIANYLEFSATDKAVIVATVQAGMNAGEKEEDAAPASDVH